MSGAGPSLARGAVLVETGRPLELWSLEVPAPGPGQVVVDVAFSGVCHSQLNEVRGLRGPDRFVPHTLGHEGAGRVVAVGEGVTKVAVGDDVVLTWLRGSGADAGGSTYGHEGDRVSSGPVSTLLDRAIVSENRVVPIPAGIALDHAALLGCALPTGAGIVFNTLGDVAGSTIVVLGMGGIGLSAVMAARAAGAAAVIGVDVVAARLKAASALGASMVVDAGAADAVDQIRAATDGGADFAIEAAGRTSAMELAMAVLRDGGLCVVAGNPPVGERFLVDPYDLIRGKRLVGTWGGASDPDLDVPRLATLMRESKLDVRPMVANVYRLDEINRAMDDLEAGRVLRPLVDLRTGT